MKPSEARRRGGLPEEMRDSLVGARKLRGWSQGELGRTLGLPQMHISSIETGRVVPRFDTLRQMARALGHDLLLVPEKLVPTVEALVRRAEIEEEETS